MRWPSTKDSTELKEFLITLVGDAPFGILVADLDGNCTMANRRASRLFQREPGEVVDRSLLDLSSDIPELRSRIETSLREGRFVYQIEELPLRDEYYSVRVQPLLHGQLLVFDDVTRQVHGRQAQSKLTQELAAANRDLEERQRRQTELLEAKRQELFRFLDKMPVAVLVTEATGKPVFSNEEAQRILGQDRLAIERSCELGQDGFPAFVRGTDKRYPERMLPVGRALAGESVTLDDIEIQNGDRRIPIHTKAAPIKDKDDQIVFALTVFEDETEKLRAQRERLQSQKLQSVGQLAAGVAHEINTPMQYIGDNAHFLRTAMANVVQMLDFYEQVLIRLGAGKELLADVEAKAKQLRMRFLSSKIPKALDAMIEGVGAVSHLVRSMKEFSHPGTDDKVPTDINAAIQTTVTISRHEWKYVADVETDLDEEIPLVPCLPGELNQVILNLIINASHAISDVVGESEDARGKIMISTRSEDHWAEIRIADTGTGMSERVRDKIFDPFFTTKKVGHGTGQGLAIARSIIVDKHGGSIAVESAEGEGALFVIRLPIPSMSAERDERRG